MLNIAGSWEPPGDDDMNLKWARDCFEATRSSSTGGACINFLTEDEGPDRIEAAYGADPTWTDLRRSSASTTPKTFPPHEECLWLN